MGFWIPKLFNTNVNKNAVNSSPQQNSAYCPIKIMLWTAVRNFQIDKRPTMDLGKRLPFSRLSGKLATIFAKRLCRFCLSYIQNLNFWGSISKICFRRVALNLPQTLAPQNLPFHLQNFGYITSWHEETRKKNYGNLIIFLSLWSSHYKVW